MKTKHALSALIAFRDSEPMDSASRAAIVADADAAETLAELESIRDRLNTLPDKESDKQPNKELQADIWENILELTAARTHKQSHFNYPVAIAASVFAMAAALVLFLQPTYMSPSSPGAEFANVTDLQARSQLLQQSLSNYNTHANTSYSGLTRAAYRDSIASVDGKINQLVELNPYDGMQAQNLWEERVDVLEDWLVMERVSRLQRTAY